MISGVPFALEKGISRLDVQLLEIGDPRWPALLSRMRIDIDHLPQTLAAYDDVRGEPSRLVVVEDAQGAMAIPLRFRTNAGGSLDAISSEVRSAPVFTEGTDAQWRREAIAELLNALQMRGVVSLFLRFHPLLDSAATEFARFGAVVEHGPTYDVPLNRPLEEIRGGMRSNHRRNIRRFHKDGFVCEPDTEWQYLEQFHELYLLTMDRVGARDEYRFPLSFFEQLRDALGEHIVLWGTVVDGQLVMAHLITDYDGIVQLLYVGAHPDFQKQVPQIGLYDAEIAWAHDHGYADFFMDGGAQESLRHFKAGISKVERQAMSARIVIDPVEYGRLCSLWELDHERVVGRADEYFPPYLQPATPQRSEPAHA